MRIIEVDESFITSRRTARDKIATIYLSLYPNLPAKLFWKMLGTKTLSQALAGRKMAERYINKYGIVARFKEGAVAAPEYVRKFVHILHTEGYQVDDPKPEEGEAVAALVASMKDDDAVNRALHNLRLLIDLGHPIELPTAVSDWCTLILACRTFSTMQVEYSIKDSIEERVKAGYNLYNDEFLEYIREHPDKAISYKRAEVIAYDSAAQRRIVIRERRR